MDADREEKVALIKDEIKQGKYRVDCKAVADAIVRRLAELSATSVTASAHSQTAVRSNR
jgi:hypothetical protein